MSRGIVTISDLGNMGRFGNQMFQYAAARKFAELSHCELQTPEWIGEKIFEISHPRISQKLPKQPADRVPWGRANVDLYGYFQFQEVVGKWNRAQLREWFKIKPQWLEKCPKKRPYYVAAHLRRGDYLTTASKQYCNVSEQSYINALNQFGLDQKDVIWVREDVPENHPEFDSASGMPFLPDFLTLVQADVILRANSTFSWWAALLGQNNKILSPVVEDKVGLNTVPFIHGNWPRMVDKRHTGGNLTDLHVPE